MKKIAQFLLIALFASCSTNNKLPEISQESQQFLNYILEERESILSDVFHPDLNVHCSIRDDSYIIHTDSVCLLTCDVWYLKNQEYKNKIYYYGFVFEENIQKVCLVPVIDSSGVSFYEKYSYLMKEYGLSESDAIYQVASEGAKKVFKARYAFPSIYED